MPSSATLLGPHFLGVDAQQLRPGCLSITRSELEISVFCNKLRWKCSLNKFAGTSSAQPRTYDDPLLSLPLPIASPCKLAALECCRRLGKAASMRIPITATRAAWVNSVHCARRGPECRGVVSCGVHRAGPARWERKAGRARPSRWLDDQIPRPLRRDSGRRRKHVMKSRASRHIFPLEKPGPLQPEWKAHGNSVCSHRTRCRAIPPLPRPQHGVESQNRQDHSAAGIRRGGRCDRRPPQWCPGIRQRGHE